VAFYLLVEGPALGNDRADIYVIELTARVRELDETAYNIMLRDIQESVLGGIGEGRDQPRIPIATIRKIIAESVNDENNDS